MFPVLYMCSSDRGHHLPAVDHDGLVPSLLLDTYHLINEIYHPSPCGRGTILWPGSEVELVDHSRRGSSLQNEGGGSVGRSA